METIGTELEDERLQKALLNKQKLNEPRNNIEETLTENMKIKL